jgi:hypothetical protein
MAERPEGGWMGYAVDVGATARPGVPRERRLPAVDPAGNLPAPQPGPGILPRSGIRTPTPVFGTSVPARGLSGVLRRAAYSVPEHRPARWALLLVADRVDVLERRAASGWWIVPAAAALALGYVAASRLARRSA